MKTQLSKPARSHARYTEEYKKEALELWRASGRSAAKVAAELGIRPPLLYRWAHAEAQLGRSGGGEPTFALRTPNPHARLLRRPNSNRASCASASVTAQDDSYTRLAR
jgi:transposase-like protein